MDKIQKLALKATNMFYKKGYSLLRTKYKYPEFITNYYSEWDYKNDLFEKLCKSKTFKNYDSNKSSLAGFMLKYMIPKINLTLYYNHHNEIEASKLFLKEKTVELSNRRNDCIKALNNLSKLIKPENEKDSELVQELGDIKRELSKGFTKQNQKYSQRAIRRLKWIVRDNKISNIEDLVDFHLRRI